MMKRNKAAVLLLVMLCAGHVLAQDQEPETLLGEITTSGGFGGPYMKVSSVGDVGAVWFGGFGGWVINHSFVIGGAGFGLLTDVDAGVDDFTGTERVLMTGYGGMWLEYHPGWKKVLHLSFATLIGGGGAMAAETDRFGNHAGEHNSDPFFIIEPAVQLNLNVIRSFRAGISAGYRYTVGFNAGRVTDAEMRSATFGFFMKFGKF